MANEEILKEKGWRLIITVVLKRVMYASGIGKDYINILTEYIFVCLRI